MKSRRILLFNTLILVTFAFTLLFYTAYFKSSSPSSKQVIEQSYTMQSELSINISMLLSDLYLTLYANKHHINKIKVSHILDKLNPLLDKASQTFGLSVKRWVDLFKVWQINNLPDVLAMKEKPSALDFDFRAFQERINASINEAIQDFSLVGFKRVIYPTWRDHQSDSKIYQSIKTIYQNKAKLLINQAKETLAKDYNKLTDCMSPSAETLTPHSIAANIVWFQYNSRYCPFLVKNKVNELCVKLKRDFPIFSSDQAARARFEKGLVFCQLADERLQQEARTAQQEYGHLTFTQYYTKQVKPLVPKYIEQLKTSVRDESGDARYTACSTSMLPVVAFRNPDIDAQVAAYEIAAPELCHGFFQDASDKDRFGSYRELAYRSLKVKY